MKTIIILLLFAIIIPFPLCLLRMKKYDISFKKMLIIYFTFSTIGFIGARFFPELVGMENAGIRLYGLVLFDVFALFLMSKLLNININKLGDFVAPPIMAVCASAKINCMLNDCCKGIVIYYNGDVPIHFPSVIFEMLIWAIFVFILLFVEKRKTIEGLMWPLMMVWFGFARFAVDFLRISEWERKTYFLVLSGGQFWSLVDFFIGGIILYVVLKKSFERNPSVKEMFKAILGIKIEKNI